MSLRQRLRSLFLISAIGLGLLAGSPMTPSEMEELFSRMNQPKVAYTHRREEGEEAYVQNKTTTGSSR